MLRFTLSATMAYGCRVVRRVLPLIRLAQVKNAKKSQALCIHHVFQKYSH
jgi:hypothetical protein